MTSRSLKRGCVGLALLACASSLSAAGENQTVTIQLSLCEGREFKFWFNDEVEENRSRCLKPLPGVPVVAVPDGDTPPKPATTDALGNAQLGPLVLGPTQKFRIAVACTEHRCLTLTGLFVGSGIVREGQNTMLVVTVPTPSAPEEPRRGKGG